MATTEPAPSYDAAPAATAAPQCVNAARPSIPASSPANHQHSRRSPPKTCILNRSGERRLLISRPPTISSLITLALESFSAALATYDPLDIYIATYLLVEGGNGSRSLALVEVTEGGWHGKMIADDLKEFFVCVRDRPKPGATTATAFGSTMTTEVEKKSSGRWL